MGHKLDECTLNCLSRLWLYCLDHYHNTRTFLLLCN